ncbi:S46 family peptidase [Riemerella columbipharyngis]|uniref:Dipeptidyl-peptidase n=1 Tax=Riemerella columbipharyngis TaxID=1071918 RepID=A0A1G7E430_9FLAO|nr:S46 family peptidase [Riemerella columbipharyngis]SDE58484.1 Peptidase S46 [Riemerella columbipharyngis]
MKRLFLVLTFLLSFLQMRADEGMWLLMLIKRLNGVDMQKEGLHLTPEEIYAVNHSSLKDAIVSFGGFCTGEIVSPEGLIFTNHHCGYGAVAAASTPEKDYLTNGFWAKNHSEEIHSKGLYVRFLERMGDATQRINAKLNNNMTAEQREAVIQQEYKAIEKENSDNGKYTVVVKDFFNGNEFYYFVYRDYKDIRLVGVPPASLGKYGGDTDNWEWPRHTADFSIFRVYADKNGNPAEYNVGNMPLAPKHFLPVSLKGVKPGNFAMILGYPGRTNRYLTSYGVEQLIKKDYPAWVDASKAAMDVMKKYMDQDDATRLGYASQYASVANYWKNRAGTIESIIKNKTVEEKENQQKVFQRWANKPANRKVYGNVLADIKAYYQNVGDRSVERNYFIILSRNAKYLYMAYRMGQTLISYSKQDSENQQKMKPLIEKSLDQYYEHFKPEVEKDMLATLVSLYQTKVPKSVQLKTLENIDANQLPQAADASVFANKESVLAFFNHPDATIVENDPLYQLIANVVEEQNAKADATAQQNDAFAKNTRLFLDGFRKVFPKKKFYPDANSTMRLTYGQVTTLPFREDRNYFGVKNNYYTDMKGLIGKYKKGDPEFDLPQRVLDLYAQKDFGIYADKAGYMPVNFLSDNDITGGNSGSPVIDADGNLIGLAFDGNSEALSGDIVFDPKIQRTINLDIRYLLWVVDVYAGAKNIVNELKLVR